MSLVAPMLAKASCSEVKTMSKIIKNTKREKEKGKGIKFTFM